MKPGGPMSNTVSLDIIARLVECGMEEKHAHIVMDLATHPPSKASDVGKRIGISRMDAYNSLRKMQDLGFVKATLDKPMRFLGLKIEEVFGLLIQKSETDFEILPKPISINVPTIILTCE